MHHVETDHDPRLAPWRANVGGPVALDAASATAPPTGAPVLALGWNVWIGRGRLAELIRTLRDSGLPQLGLGPGTPLVALVQEATRTDDSVPARSNGATGRELFRRSRLGEDVVETARALGLNLRYVPSMRNGPHRSDRGNAILSTLPILDAQAFELPFVFQRRVILAATLRAPGGGPLRVVSAHLDPRGLTGRDWLGVAGRARQAERIVTALGLDHGGPTSPLLLGADLNLARGWREPAWRRLAEAGFRHGVPHRSPAWRHTYHRAPRLVLDYLLIRDPARAVVGAEIRRLDEHPRDRGPYVFRSDHHPLAARLELDGSPPRETGGET
ncbi:MAG TPA: endonuclease/exonuclease/phosphatase family protein [Gemmatimonadales bacterium]|nr:endonuclease/exonuclease/phosphatase family protein [Gemmatimonadales bacterium]